MIVKVEDAVAAILLRINTLAEGESKVKTAVTLLSCCPEVTLMRADSL
jgi:hypothetical protein